MDTFPALEAFQAVSTGERGAGPRWVKGVWERDAQQTQLSRGRRPHSTLPSSEPRVKFGKASVATQTFQGIQELSTQCNPRLAPGQAPNATRAQIALLCPHYPQCTAQAHNSCTIKISLLRNSFIITAWKLLGKIPRSQPSAVKKKKKEYYSINRSLINIGICQP